MDVMCTRRGTYPQSCHSCLMFHILSLQEKWMDTTYQMENPNLFWRTTLLLLLERPLDMINNPLRGGFLIFYYTVLHPDKNAILHELTGSYFYYSPLENHRYTNNVTFWKMLPSHYSKKEVCAQLFDLEKGFKICYVYVKRKPK